MATPPRSPPPSDEPSKCTSRRSRQPTRLRSLTRRNLDQRRPRVNVNPQTGRASGPHKDKFHSYLGVVAREKIPIIHEYWKDVPENLKQLIWDDILGRFEISEPLAVKKKVMSSVATRWRQFKSSLTCKYIYADKQGEDKEHPCVKYGLDKDTWEAFAASRKNPSWQGVRKKAQEIQKFNDSPHVLSRGGYELLEKKLMEEKIKRRLQDAMFTENPTLLDEPPSPIARHVKWKMARTKKYGRMTSTAAQEISDKIDLLEEQTTQGSFVPHGRNDILNTALGRPEHPGRVRVAGDGVTIRQYFGQASRSSSSSVPCSNCHNDLANVIANLKEEWRREQDEVAKKTLDKITQEVKERMKEELKEAIKMELSQMASPPSPPLDLDIQQKLARVSTKGSCSPNQANPSVEEHVTNVVGTMGLHVVCNEAMKLVAMGKVEHGVGTIHNVAYADDVVRVTVKEIIDGDAEVPFPSSEIQYVRQTLGTFVPWPTYLVKVVPHEDAQGCSKKPSEDVQRSGTDANDDPLGNLIQNLFVFYKKPVELLWDGTKFGLPTVLSSFFITFADVNEIVSGDKSLNISVLQLWMMFMEEQTTSLGHGSVYGFLEPQSILYAKGTTQDCEKYIETWVKESQRQLYLGAYFNEAHWQLVVLCPYAYEVVWFCSLHRKPDIHIKSAINKAMKTLKPTFHVKTSNAIPKWIEVKSHVQTGGYECGYYVMHWMWNIVTGHVKSEWNKWFLDPTPLDMAYITTIRQKWAAYLLQVKKKSLTQH